MRMYEASKLAANVGMGEDLQASYDGFITQIKQYTNNNEKHCKLVINLYNLNIINQGRKI